MPRRQTIFVKRPLLTLEQELQRHLHDAGIVRPVYITKFALASVVDQPIRIRELRMVEDIESLWRDPKPNDDKRKLIND
jgi:hypothetical protein